MNKLLLPFLFFCMSYTSSAQEIRPLWEGNIPKKITSSEKEFIATDREIIWIEKIQVPTIKVYHPTKRFNNHKAVLLFPGGGYKGLAYDLEGEDFAKWLNTLGFTAIVVKYRVPVSEAIKDNKDVPLIDAQRAIRLVRANAKKWEIDTNKIGVMGFSAGGHLAATLGTHFSTTYSYKKDAIDTLNARPDFMLLAYPVISMQNGVTHNGSRNNLLGTKPTKELIDWYSNEFQVSAQTPPTFLIHCADDGAVSVQNTLLFYNALLENKVEAEMHIYQKGGHGFGLGTNVGDVGKWTVIAAEWLEKI
ncbi:alpha/beta hydrolase [Flammeovirga kamogawensis]|uniref:Alpha/beta hydrolase n=1 Tax=Flammeovirga kamogawensis TaxID=373891 RepID=A0ABX8H1J3_9BACT|nr:alpha/beta hydrolase [Flammeovirga kamogawensis]MBB6463960.1 acetyl esterase/lipase [Flammeovirga kamogawensis]QWG09763.1 alpha/beta hydrolase [Flammeovirga kamogawensis]TRX65273.1 alpha/beta hydrolase [Flammeovirga kamogawensis]